MTRALTSALALALLALPLVADEPKKSETKAAATQPAAEDSPLVAASKRMNRLGRKPKSKVITNETLKQAGDGAHVTTSEQQPAIRMPAPSRAPEPTPEMMAAKKRAEEQKLAAEAEAAKQKAEEQRLRRMAAASEMAEEEYPDDVDPAEAEKALRDAAEAQKEQKPPRI